MIWLKGIVSALLFAGVGVIFSMIYVIPLTEYLFKPRGWPDITAVIALFLFMLQALVVGGWIGWKWGIGNPFIELI